MKLKELNYHFAVCQATIDELEELANLFNEYRIFYKQAFDLDGAKRFLLNRFEHLESILFIAKDTALNKAIGFTQLYPLFSSISMNRTWVLNDLYVIQEYRRRGVAKLLLDSAKTYAMNTGSKGLELSTAVDNEGAQRLYERNGYRRDEEFYHYNLSL